MFLLYHDIGVIRKNYNTKLCIVVPQSVKLLSFGINILYFAKLSGSFSCPNITAQALLTDEIATNHNKAATVFKKYCLNFSISNHPLYINNNILL